MQYHYVFITQILPWLIPLNLIFPSLNILNRLDFHSKLQTDIHKHRTKTSEKRARKSKLFNWMLLKCLLYGEFHVENFRSDFRWPNFGKSFNIQFLFRGGEEVICTYWWCDLNAQNRFTKCIYTNIGLFKYYDSNWVWTHGHFQICISCLKKDCSGCLYVYMCECVCVC